MEEAVAQGVAQEALDDGGAQRLQVVAVFPQSVDIRHLAAVDPLHGEHALGGADPVDFRHPEPGIFGGVFRHLRKSGRFQAEIHFQRD